MATFIGFNTIDQNKRYVLTDFALIKRDLLNAFNIRQGEMPGRPEVGTTLWNFIFEPQTPENTTRIKQELQRIVDLDPRIGISSVNVYSAENGILLELEVDTIKGVGAETLIVQFDQNLQSANYV
jgi:phage baseplate assembly protein W